MARDRGRTRSGLTILKRGPRPWFVRFEDLSIFTVENDHNPPVASTCPQCAGAARWSHDDPVTGAHYDCRCPRCGGDGVIDQPAPLFDNDRPPAAVRADAEGRAQCPACGVRFRTTDRAVWTGWRHSCGQRLNVQQEA